MIKKYNYFAGLRITTNNAVMTNNRDSLSGQVLPEYRNYVFTNPNERIKSYEVNQTLLGFQYSPVGGYLKQGGFVEFFKAN